MRTISKTTRNNLLFSLAPLFVAEVLMCYPVFVNHFPLWQLLIPVSLLTLVPKAFLLAAWESPSYESYAWLLALIAIDVVFLLTMVFSIARNHKVMGGACLLVFILSSIVLVAGGS